VTAVHELTLDQQVEQILAAWETSDVLNGQPFNKSRQALLDMARLAAQRLSGPRQWRAGEHIPPDVDQVWTVAGNRWTHVDGPVWQTVVTLNETDLLDQLGPVQDEYPENVDEQLNRKITGLVLQAASTSSAPISHLVDTVKDTLTQAASQLRVFVTRRGQYVRVPDSDNAGVAARACEEAVEHLDVVRERGYTVEEFLDQELDVHLADLERDIRSLRVAAGYPADPQEPPDNATVIQEVRNLYRQATGVEPLTDPAEQFQTHSGD
jgi:hypothetical protein